VGRSNPQRRSTATPGPIAGEASDWKTFDGRGRIGICCRDESGRRARAFFYRAERPNPWERKEKEEEAMKRTLFALALGALVAATAASGALAAEKKNPVVVLKTNMGSIKIELYPDKAPETVKNFLWYVDHHFYDGLIFHRVIKNFMIQGGGFTKDMKKKEPNAPIVNEATNGLSNKRGTIAMARTMDINSATSQFFINLKDNTFLDHKNNTPRGYGYAVFGKVIDGMDVVDAIGNVKTTSRKGYDDVPVDPVVILKAYRLGKSGKK